MAWFDEILDQIVPISVDSFLRLLHVTKTFQLLTLSVLLVLWIYCLDVNLFDSYAKWSHGAGCSSDSTPIYDVVTERATPRFNLVEEAIF